MNVVEWTINNFSYWNVLVHEKQIECSGSGFTNCPRILLYPRGLSGCEEHIAVQVYALPDESSALSGHLSCIDSCGSLLCTLDIEEKARKEACYELFSKLKFDDIAAKARKCEIQDRFTLRCELKWEEDGAYRLYTTVDVFDSTVKIDPTQIKFEKCDISTIEYSLKESGINVLYLHLTKDQNELYIEPDYFKKNILVSTCLSVLKCDSVTRTEENERVFQDRTRRKFINSLTSEEWTEEGVSFLLRIKIAPGNKYTHSYAYYTGFRKSVDVLPTNILTLSNSLNAATSNKPENSATVLVNELMCLYQDHDFSDFQLRCGDVSFPTHKSILSVRSPVFKAMFLSHMKEAATDSMNVADLDVHTLGRFLVFLYTGKVDDLEWEAALKLYYAADKYQVPTLKRECLAVFHKNVDISNVCDILSLADKHQDEELTSKAHDFILKNYNDVLRSEGWKTFMKNEPVFAVKTLTYFAEKNVFKVIPDS